MNDNKNVLLILLQGSSFGLVGLVVGFCTIMDSISISTAFRYTIVALISGAIAFYLVGESIYHQHDYIAAIGSGWMFFFLAKGLSVILQRFAISPVKTWVDIKNTIRGKK